MPDSNVSSPSWIPVLSALGGVIVGLLSPLVTSFVTAKRERESRREAKSDSTQQQQNIFQRETLLGLQDYALKLFLSIGEIRMACLLSNDNKCSDELYKQADSYSAQVSLLRVRARDETVRELSRALAHELLSVHCANNFEKMEDAYDKADDIFRDLNERIGTLLRSLDDAILAA